MRSLHLQIAATGLTGRERIIALEELAKLYEHKLKELEQGIRLHERGD